VLRKKDKFYIWKQHCELRQVHFNNYYVDFHHNFL